MSYFADLTPYTYTPAGNLKVLNVGWLDSAHLFLQGDTSSEFREMLGSLCGRPIHLHRGFHDCDFCRTADVRQQENWKKWANIGNGQIRVLGLDEIWYAAPTMIHHYVIEHRYLPPAMFIEAVLHPFAVGVDFY
jgi:hypothetical protein